MTEEIAESGIALMEAAGHEVDVRLGLSPEQLLEALPGAAALIVRSATKVTSEAIAAGSSLVVVGRAGIGVDNIDLDAATKAGVLVVNAPESNVLSAAEHALALLLAQARNIPQAHAALVDGRWERSRWGGVELYGKTLGVIGLGRVGTLVAKRAASFGMRLVAYDPYVSNERAAELDIELVTLDRLMQESDFVTIHLPKTKETLGLLGADMLAKAKAGLRIVNTARGGIVDEQALAQAISEGRVGGAALDVFAAEPTTSSALFSLPTVVVTPHLGASTTEAQDKAGITIAEQVKAALGGDLVPFAVNLSAKEVPQSVRPFVELAESLGRLLVSLVGALPQGLEVECGGALAEADTKVLTLSALRGILAAGTEEPVSFVNAPRVASERGLEVKEVSTSVTKEYVNLLTLRGGGHCVAGTLAGVRGEPRVVMVDEHRVEVPPSEHMLVVRNDDSPGMIGIVGTILGEQGISISSMGVGPSAEGGTALMVLSTDQDVPGSVCDTLRSAPGILAVAAVTAGS